MSTKRRSMPLTLPAVSSPDPPLEPEQTPAQKRLTNLHITACPGLINTDLLPEAARQATDFRAIDPTIHRKNHTVRNNNVTTFTKPSDGSEPITMMTEKQISARLTNLGLDMRKAAEQERRKKATTNDGATDASSPTAEMLCPKGYRTQLMAPPFDKRSTYRADYCQEKEGGFQDGARRAHLATYRDTWSAEETTDVAASMKQPYLTCPASVCRDPPTEYRAGFMPEATSTDFRTLSHKTNLPELGTTFAYSAYAVDDPRRSVSFDAKVASLKEPRSFLYDASAAGGAAKAADEGHTRKEESELQRMRALRTESLKRSCVLRESRRAAVEATKESILGGDGTVRNSRRADDYIYLPQAQFV